MNFLPCKFLLKCPSNNPLVLFKHSQKWKIWPTFQLVFEKFCLNKPFDILASINYTAIIRMETTNIMSRKRNPKITMYGQVAATLRTGSHGMNHKAIEYIELGYIELMVYRTTPWVMKEEISGILNGKG